MKYRLCLFLALCLLNCIYSCKKKDNDLINPLPPTSDSVVAENNRLSHVVTTQTATAFISGTVMDEDGTGLPGVMVSAGNATVTTNNQGYFQFPGSVSVNKDYAVITATRTGYFKGIRTFTPNALGKANHYVEIKLLKPNAEKTVASSGGNIVLDNKIDITFPNAAVVTATGAVYSGEYKVAARYIDPVALNFLDIMPGLLTGLNDQNGLQALQSFGMAVIELKDASDNPLQIAPGKKVTLKLPAPANGPATIPLWHFNETYGLWVKAGTATKTGNTYTAEVTHFSTWNLDVEFNSFRLDLQFKDQAGNAVSGLHAEVRIDGENKIKSFYTDNEGKVTLINCPASKPIIIKMFFQCDTASKTIDPLTASRSEVITVQNGPRIKSYMVTGKLSGCDNAPMANQPFKITIQGDGSSLGLPGVTDAQGNYTVTGIICNNSNAVSAQAMAFINNEYRYATAASITAINSSYNAQICDTAAAIPDNFQILFPDPALDSLIRAKIHKPVGPILYGDVKNIDSLTTFSPTHDLSGIEFCSRLRVLDIRYGANFSDIRVLKKLLNLQRLWIFETFDRIKTGNGLITDISPLQNLPQLKRLELICPSLSDVSPLKNMENLQYFRLESRNLTNISALSNLTHLNTLGLTSNALSDIRPLQNLTQLKTLDIASKLLTRSDLLDLLQNLKSLTDLSVSGTSISDFTFVKNLPQLLSLYLGGNQISDVSQFASLTNLTSLGLANSKITDISALQTLTDLQYLVLTGNQITDISPLKSMSAASIIVLDYNKISDVTPLQNLNNLQALWLNNNQVSNITPLINGVSNLQFLAIGQQQTGTITQSQQDAFTKNHPACFVQW